MCHKITANITTDTRTVSATAAVAAAISDAAHQNGKTEFQATEINR